MNLYHEDNKSSHSDVTITVDGLSATLLMASIFYLFCAIIVIRRLMHLHSINPEFGTKKMLVFSLGLVCIIRLMSFFGVVALDSENVLAHYSFHPFDQKTSQDEDPSYEDRNQHFYDKAMIVLFDLPNCIVVSTYVLLAMVWAECVLLSRFHTEDAFKWRTRWLSTYMLFNAALYSIQITLYLCVLIPYTSSIATPLLYVVMTVINVATVILVFTLYIFLGVKFSGYPFRSINSKKAMRIVSTTIAFWSITRILWAMAMFSVFLDDKMNLIRNDSVATTYLYLFFLFFICEILPIIAMLDYSYDAIFEFDARATREMQMLASGEQIVNVSEKDHESCTKTLNNTQENNNEKSVQDSLSSFSKFNWTENQRSLFGEESLSHSQPLLDESASI